MDHPNKNRTIIVISLVTIIVSVAVILGWVFHITVMKQIVPGFVSMVFNTAFCFVLFGGALLSTQYPTGKYQNLIFALLSLICTLVGLITLLQFIFHFNTGLDQLFISDPEKVSSAHLFPGRMAFNTSVNIFLLGLGLLMLTVKSRLFNVLAQYLFHAVIILTAVALIGYLYGVSLFYSFFYVSSMATHTAVIFFILAIAASLLNPSIGVTRMFTGNEIGNKMGKRLFILMLIPILIFGSLRVQTQHYGLFSLEVGISLLAVLVLLLSLLLIWDTANRLNKIDTQRSEAEAEIKSMNADLEKTAEERTRAYQKSEEKYHSLIEHASDAIYVVDFKGNFTDANASMCKMTGYTHEELLQLNVEDIIDPEELKVDPVKHGPRNPGEYVMRERRLVRKDGSLFDAEVNVKRFQDDRILVIARDITGRKKMEAESREAELKFRTLAEKSMVGVYISQKEKFIYVNPRFAEVFGYKPDEMLNAPGSAIDLIISEEYTSMVRGNVNARYSGQIDNTHYEVVGKRKDGTTNWVEFYGSRVILNGEPTIIGSMIDVTERKKAGELILREKTLSETIINSLPGVFYLHNDKGKYLRWNKNFETVTGYTVEEIEKINAKDLIADEDKERVTKAIGKIFKEGYIMVEVKVKTKYDVNIPFLLTGTPLIYENQQCLLGTGVDISSRIKAEEELRSSEQKYKLLFDSNPLPLWMIAKDNLAIIAVNEAAANLYGYTKNELLKMDVTALRPAEDIEIQQERYKVDASGSIDMGVVRHIKKDKTIIFVQIIAHDIIFDDRPVRLSLTNDVTEKLKAEELLQKSEANLQTILKTTDTAYALFGMDMKVLEFNQKAIQFVKEQYDHAVEKGDSLGDYFPKDRFPQFINFAGEVLKGKNISYEIDYPQPNGTVCWFYVRLFPITNDNKEILGMMMALYDITERKNAEQDLKNAYERIHSHINSIKGMAWKQSHLMRSPLANLKALAAMLKDEPSDAEVIDHFKTELDRLDAIIHEMAAEASDNDIGD